MAHGAETRISGGATADEGPSNGGRELCRRSTPDGCEGAAVGVLRPGRASSAAAWPRTGAREPSRALSAATPPRTDVRESPQVSSAAAPSWKGAREPPWPSSTVSRPQTGTSSWSGGASPRCLSGGGDQRLSGHGVVAEHACGSSRVPIGGGAVAPVPAWGWSGRRSSPVGGAARSLGRSGRQSSSDSMVGRREVHLTCGPRMSGAQSA